MELCGFLEIILLVEVIPCSGRLDIIFSNGEVSKAFTFISFLGIFDQDGLQFANDFFVGNRAAVQFV